MSKLQAEKMQEVAIHSYVNVLFNVDVFRRILQHRKLVTFKSHVIRNTLNGKYNFSDMLLKENTHVNISGYHGSFGNAVKLCKLNNVVMM